MSALQKEVRRGNEQAALTWVSELDLSGYGAWAWSRLRVIASEDVGLAWPEGAALVRSLYENWRDSSKNGKAEARLFLAHAVMALCRASKSRAVDHATWVFWDGPLEPVPIPDYALDKHTKRGRQLGRGWSHFLTEGARLSNEADLDDPYRERGYATRRGEL
ncbi:MAG: hypothetical protein ACJ760_14070 [Thermoleophilaceae bacterium]